MAREAVKDFYGKVLGYVDTDSSGNKTVTDYYGKVLGYYKKASNITTDYYGRKLTEGDTAISLIWIKK